MRERYLIAVFVAVHPDDGHWNSRNMLLLIYSVCYLGGLTVVLKVSILCIFVY